MTNEVKKVNCYFIVKIESFEGHDTFLRCGNPSQDYLFAVTRVDNDGRAEIVDNGYRSFAEAAEAWPKAAAGGEQSKIIPCHR